ncbi:MAG: 30S ribosomal protein S17 [Parcubacteria group bacterium RIFCSPHIGHO2_01_FULL_45_26]|nr:ribosomal protein S17 [uncultured bacterium]OHB17553.1 MAG: 30S ribosomal protein S17 [Parcubacteria group bacterium RIFCSPHIGHO2_01_FULL_45_26]
MQSNANNNKGRSYKGVVVSDKMDKTRVVEVSSIRKHPLYGKYIKRTKRFKVHDQENAHKVGDKVTIVETRPISKDKNFIFVDN